ncbi:MAG TPA: glycosyltransferase [Streptosporangiaceae bacterium]
MAPNDTYPQHVVTAVIVAHDGASWLPHVIDALLGQTRPVQRVVAVDTGSRDRSGSVLAAKLGQSVVFGMDRTTGYGAALAKALQHKAANANVPGPGRAARSDRDRDERVEWIWLLHDDCEPASDALEQLLRGAAETPKAAVLGPKVMDWSDRDVILEAGLTIDTVGRRITGIEPREVDQGQHDGDRDTLAVGSAGMLVRRDVWDLIHGFDTSMGLYREDIDFCWRVHAAGYRVRVVTDAVVFHLQAVSRRRRAVSVGRRSRLLDRRNALLTLAGNLPTGPMLRSMAGNVMVSILRALFFLVAKRVSAAVDEMAAVASVLGHPLRLRRVRRMRARGRRAAYGRLRADLPPGRSFRRVAEFAAAMAGSAQQDTAGSHHATEDPADDDFLLVDSGIAQRILTSPGVLLFLGLMIVTAVAERAVLGAGTLGGGALLPATSGASGLWREYLQGFHPTGIGSPSAAPPYLAIVAILATIAVGKAWLAVDVILLGSVPIAGMAAFLALRRVTASVPVRVWAAATYALIPVATGAISAGRLGTAAAFALIPLIGLLAGRVFSQPPRIARRAAWATGLALAFGTAFVPLLWPIALVAAAAAALGLRKVRPGVLRNLAIVVIVPPFLLIPWTFELAAHPSMLLLEAGARQPGLASSRLPTRALMLLSPGGPGLPPFWVTAGLALAALVALVAARRRILVLSGWTVAVLGLLVAVLVSRVAIRPAVGGPAVAVWPGAALAVAAAGLLLAAAAGGDSLGRLLSGGRSGLRRLASTRGLAVVVLALAACSVPVLAAGSWLLHGVSGPIGPASGQIVPALVSVSGANGDQPRTLVLSSAGQHVSYLLLRGSGPALGDGDLTPVPAAERALSTAVASLVAPAGGQAANQGLILSRFDIGFVLMRAPVNQDLARTLNGINGLRAVSMTPSFDLWRLASLPARVSVVEPNGTVVPVPSGQVGTSGAAAPPAGGILTVADPAGGWHATLDGRQLQAVPSPAGSWAQAFRLPSGGGRLDIGRSQLGRDASLAVELLAVLVVAALALPGSRTAAEAQAATGATAAAGNTEDSALADGAAPEAGADTGGAGAGGAGTGGTGEPAGAGGLPARGGDRPGGQGRSRGRGLGRRGRRPGQDETVPSGPQRRRAGAGQGSHRAPDDSAPDAPDSASPVPVGAGAAGASAAGAGAAGAGAVGLSAAGAAAAGLGAASLGAASADAADLGGAAAGSRRPAGSRAAWPADEPGSRLAGDVPRPGGRPDPTAAGRAGFDRRGSDDPPPLYGEPASEHPVPAGAAYGAPVGSAISDATPRGSGAYDSPAYDSPAYDRAPYGSPSSDNGAHERGATDSGAYGRGASDGGAYGGPNVGGAHGGPNDGGAFGGSANDSGTYGRGANSGSTYGADAVGGPGPGGSGYDRPARDLADFTERGTGGRGWDGSGIDDAGTDRAAADRAASGRAAPPVRSPTGAWPYPDDSSLPGGAHRGQPETRSPAPGDSRPGTGRPQAPQRAAASWEEAARPRRPQPEPSGPEPVRRDPGRPGQVSRDLAGQDLRWQEAQQPPGLPATSGGWPRQQSQPSWPDSEPPSSWPASEPSASWPASEQRTSWRSGDEPGSWRSGEQPAPWPAAGQPAAGQAAPRPAAEPPPRWSADGPPSAWRGAHPGGSPPADGPDWQESQPEWAGAGDALEPLPSAGLPYGTLAPEPDDERSRRRWPAPERDEPDDRDAW